MYGLTEASSASVLTSNQFDFRFIISSIIVIIITLGLQLIFIDRYIKYGALYVLYIFFLRARKLNSNNKNHCANRRLLLSCLDDIKWYVIQALWNKIHFENQISNNLN